MVTGLTRSEVRKLLEEHPSAGPEWYRNRARRVLDGWRTDKDFLDRRKRPIDIALRGKRRSLEELVRRHAGDIPTRAILDELLQARAVTRPSKGSLRLVRSPSTSRTSVRNAQPTIASSQRILEALASALLEDHTPAFGGEAISGKLDAATAAYLEAFLAKRAGALLAIAKDQMGHQLKRASTGRRHKSDGTRVGIHVHLSRRLA